MKFNIVGKGNFGRCARVNILMERERKLLIINDACRKPLLDEISLLKAPCAASVFEADCRRQSGSLLKSMVAAVRRKAEAARICRAAGNGIGAVLAYGAAEIAGAVAANLKVPCVSRSELKVNPSVNGLQRAERHTVAQHALTIVTHASDPLTAQKIAALAIARPGSQIVWRPLSAWQAPISLPGNLEVSQVQSLKAAVEESAVDWFVAFGSDVADEDVLKSLSAGIPVATDNCDLADRLLDDDCAVIFGPSPENEEFVRGLLPFIESDYRSQSMSDSALSRWHDNYNLEINGPNLVAEIGKLLTQSES